MNKEYFTILTKYHFIKNKIDDTKKQIKENEETMKLLKQSKQRIEWYDDFIDYIQCYSINLYNEACEYADNKEME
tara:strand:- start:535 stop:759 length:225 start_codon:yes stop_codon:yes gene_type:complete